MKFFLLAGLVILVGIAVAIGINSSLINNPPTKGLSIPTQSYTLLRIEGCNSEKEQSCRVMAESPSSTISFKLDYRYRDIIKPSFEIKATAACIKEIFLADQRSISFDCLPFFSKPK